MTKLAVSEPTKEAQSARRRDMKITPVPKTNPDITIELSFDEYATLRVLCYCCLAGNHPTRETIERAFREIDKTHPVNLKERSRIGGKDG